MTRDLHFGPFTLSMPARTLRCRASVVALKPKEVDLLALLVGEQPNTVSKDAIVERLWPNAVASDAALSQTVYRLRRALNECDRGTEYVRTVPGIGFQFVGVRLLHSTSRQYDFARPEFSAYQRAMFRLQRRSERAVLESIDLFRAVVAAYPTYAPALVGLAQAYTHAGIRLFISPDDAYWRARETLETAIDLDASSADAFAALGMLLLFFGAAREQVRDASEHALLLAPESLRARSLSVWECFARRDTAAALGEAGLAVQVNPSSAHLTTLLGIALYMARRYDKAIGHFSDALNVEPGYAPALFYDAAARVMIGDYDRALARLDTIPRADMSSRSLAVRAYIYAKSGDSDRCAQLIRELRELPIPSHISLSAVYIAREEFEEASNVLARALHTREPGLFLTTIDPMYEPLNETHPQLMRIVALGRPRRCDRCNAEAQTDGSQPELHRTLLCARCRHALAGYYEIRAVT